LKMLLEQGRLTLHHMDETAKRDKLCFDVEAKSKEEAATREKLCFELDTKKDKIFAHLVVAKAMNDIEELKMLKREANECHK